MKYSEVLHDYQPSEMGDFMLRFDINECEYIIYSPEPGKVSCVELRYFRELSACQLAILLSRKVQANSELPEISFDYSCSREQLLTYLFDIDATESNTLKKTRRASGNEGYLLSGISNPSKIVNFFQYDASGKESLVFNNISGYAECGSDTDTVHVTWSPFQFSLLEEGISNHSYLLSSSSPLLLSFIFPKVKDKKILLYSGRNPLEALFFLSHYTLSSGSGKMFRVQSSGEEVMLSLEGWNPITVVRFVSRMNKSANSVWMEEYALASSSDFTAFRLQSAGGMSFVLFSGLESLINVFLSSYIPEVGLESVFSLC